MREVGTAVAIPAMYVLMPLAPLHEPFRTEARVGDDGFWRIDTVTIPFAGRWTIALDIRLTRFEMTRGRGEMEIL